MNDQATTQDGVSLAVTTPLGKDVLILQELTGTEYISNLFQFTLVMRSSTGAFDLDLSGLIDQSITVTLTGDQGAKRYINGICCRVVQTATAYVAELRPWLWKLGLASDHCIYQSQSAVEIIKKVFSTLGYTDIKDSTTATYAKRDYCVQYGETSLAFVLRLMEDEGLYYFFTHEDGKHTLVLADDVSACADIAGSATVPYLVLSPGKQWVVADHVGSCSLAQEVVSGSYQSDDYAFITPATELKATATGAVKGHKVYEYPGNYQAKNAGDARAKLRVAELQARNKSLSGTGVVRAFAAGCKFTLSDNPRADLNASWTLHSVSHHATARIYDNRFTALPAETAFRPPRCTPVPRIVGSQIATVVGKSGEEIYTDQYGRIKVQFPWDQLGKNDENSSCWVRVAQGWAGKNWGTFFLPRIGMEVLVSFLDGNPDLPIVTGCVYNGTNPVPYTLSADQTKSTIKTNSSKDGKGYNEIRFEDKTDSEELYFQAQKDMKVLVNNSRTVTIDKADDTLTLNEGNRSATVTKGNDSLTITEGNLTISVAKGNETLSVKGKRDLTVEGAETHTCKAAFTHKISGNFTLKVDGNISIEAGGSISLKSGTGLTITAGTDMTAKGGTGATVQAGTTLSLKGSASATLDGGGMTTVKGGMINLN
ncbi:MAG: type VI secretion system tip protein TssI/VgrG [Rhodospirillaceae bacterium]